MMWIETELKLKRRGRWPELMKQAINEMNIEVAAFAVQEARDLAPADTGELIDGINAGNIDYKGFTLISEAPYSVYLEMGTREHFIAPVNAKALHWKQGSTSFFSKGHMVSGIKAKPFLFPAMMNARRIMDKEYNKAINKAFS